MNGRISKIIWRHAAKMIADKKIPAKDAARVRRQLKRRYMQLNAAERDDFGLRFTPFRTILSRSMRRAVRLAGGQ